MKAADVRTTEKIKLYLINQKRDTRLYNKGLRWYFIDESNDSNFKELVKTGLFKVPKRFDIFNDGVCTYFKFSGDLFELKTINNNPAIVGVFGTINLDEATL